jgi:hypothetical protein
MFLILPTIRKQRAPTHGLTNGPTADKGSSRYFMLGLSLARVTPCARLSRQRRECVKEENGGLIRLNSPEVITDDLRIAGLGFRACLIAAYFGQRMAAALDTLGPAPDFVAMEGMIEQP